MRPGFLGDLQDFWFGDITQANPPTQGWRRSSSRPSDARLNYRPQTKIAWYDQFWVEEPYWEKYWDN